MSATRKHARGKHPVRQDERGRKEGGEAHEEVVVMVPLPAPVPVPVPVVDCRPLWQSETELAKFKYSRWAGIYSADEQGITNNVQSNKNDEWSTTERIALQKERKIKIKCDQWPL